MGNNTKLNNVQENMKGVINTSIYMRDYLLNPDKTNEEKRESLDIFKQAINANKSIVSATVAELSWEKFTDGK